MHYKINSIPRNKYAGYTLKSLKIKPQSAQNSS
jgi:hypothetical protein